MSHSKSCQARPTLITHSPAHAQARALTHTRVHGPQTLQMQGRKELVSQPTQTQGHGVRCAAWPRPPWQDKARENTAGGTEL